MKDTCAFCQPEDTRKMIKALNEHGQPVMVHADEHDAYSKRVAHLQLEQSEKAIAEMVAKVDTLKALLAESEPRPEVTNEDRYAEYLAALRFANENPIPLPEGFDVATAAGLSVGNIWGAKVVQGVDEHLGRVAD